MGKHGERYTIGNVRKEKIENFTKKKSVDLIAFETEAEANFYQV